MIGIDCTFLSVMECRERQFHISFSIFLAELLDAFTEMGLQKQFCLIVNYYQVPFLKERFPGYTFCVIPFFPGEIMMKLLGERHGTARINPYLKKSGAYARALQKEDLQMVWFPCASLDGTVELELPVVYTVHDLIDYHKKTDQPDMVAAYTELVQRATHLVAISDYTRKDIIESFGYEKEISVVHNSIQMDISVQEPLAEQERPFILCLNGYGEHKNTLTLIKAYQKIMDETELDLICCGGWMDEDYWEMLQAYLQENDLRQRVHLHFAVPQAQRNWLLGNASLFVTPSLKEGFGRTPVEAAICKIPVISSTCDSLQEATQGVVQYYQNARSVQELSDVMLQSIKNPPKEEMLEEISRKLTDIYKPVRLAEKYWSVFQKVLNEVEKL